MAPIVRVHAIYIHVTLQLVPFKTQRGFIAIQLNIHACTLQIVQPRKT